MVDNKVMEHIIYQINHQNMVYGKMVKELNG